MSSTSGNDGLNLPPCFIKSRKSYSEQNHAIADPIKEEQIVKAMHKFIIIANSMLRDNFTGYIPQPGDTFDKGSFGLARAHELSTTLQWLYEVHPDGQQDLIWETMNLMWSAAVIAEQDWAAFFIDGVFPKKGEKSEETDLPNFDHGVNLAQGRSHQRDVDVMLTYGRIKIHGANVSDDEKSESYSADS